MKRSFVLLSLLFAASGAAAQSSSMVETQIVQVTDRRSPGPFSDLSIGMELPKIKSSQVVAARVIVTRAVDDTGADLVNEEKETSLDPVGRPDKDDPVHVTVQLKNPSRKAKAVKEVRGDVELFMPGRDPNSVADVAKFLSFTGKTINHKALKANGVEITLLSKAQIEAERKKIAAAKRQEYKEAGFQDGPELDEYVKNAMDYVLVLEPNELPLRIKDPQKVIQEIEYVDAKGEAERVFTHNVHEDIDAIGTWGDAPTAAWGLRVKMKTAKNVVRHSFVLTDVKLP